MRLGRRIWVASAIATTSWAAALLSCGDGGGGKARTGGTSQDASSDGSLLHDGGTAGEYGSIGEGGPQGDAGASPDAPTFEGGVTFTEYALPTDGGTRHPVDITLGPDGNLWFTDSNGSTIWRITPAGALTPFRSEAAPQGITAATDDALWFAAIGGVGRVALDGGMQLYALDGGRSWYGIAQGPDMNLWVTGALAPYALGRLGLDGTMTEFPVPDAGAPLGPQQLAPGPGGVWYAQFNQLGRVDSSGNVTLVPLPDGGGGAAESTVAAPDGTMWYAGGSTIGHVAADGTVTAFPIPQGSAFGITFGPDGNLWFTDSGKGRIGRCTTAGEVTEFDIPSPLPEPLGITRGPGNTIWFTEANAAKIGVVTLH